MFFSKRVKSEPVLSATFHAITLLLSFDITPLCQHDSVSSSRANQGIKLTSDLKGCSLRAALGGGGKHSGAMATDDNTGMVQITAVQASSDYTLLLNQGDGRVDSED